MTSKCNPNYAQYNAQHPYPAYDPRCRKWYQFALKSNDYNSVSFQYPRVSTSGKYVVTGVLPIKKSSSGKAYGVLNSNFLVTSLSNEFNSVKILKSGYVYLIDTRNTSYLIIHPKATSTCSRVQCAESMSDSEYSVFETKVLLPIQNGASSKDISTTYTKKGKKWRLEYSSVTFENIHYTLIATVPQSEILEASKKPSDSINKSVTDMIIGFVFAVFFFIVLLLFVVRFLIRSIVNPVNNLRNTLQAIRNEDFSKNILQTTEAVLSSDMKVLLEAFSRLLIALRFGSNSYARGDQHQALSTFQDALELFTTINNSKGIGASLNNLAAVELSMGNLKNAEKHYLEAVSNVEELLSKATTENEKMKLQRLLSDRKGNLTILYLEQSELAKAFDLLETLLAEVCLFLLSFQKKF
jgi:tetratricopeptide (TPR) repeat protein